MYMFILRIRSCGAIEFRGDLRERRCLLVFELVVVGDRF